MLEQACTRLVPWHVPAAAASKAGLASLGQAPCLQVDSSAIEAPSVEATAEGHRQPTLVQGKRLGLWLRCCTRLGWAKPDSRQLPDGCTSLEAYSAAVQRLRGVAAEAGTGQQAAFVQECKGSTAASQDWFAGQVQDQVTHADTTAGCSACASQCCPSCSRLCKRPAVSNCRTAELHGAQWCNSPARHGSMDYLRWLWSV